jgi:RNA polymerase sigma-70 factor (ECF subfamily)
MSVRSPEEITDLLLAWGHGDQAALERLAPLVHAQLHRLARRYMAGERPGHVLQTTALIHEAYARLIDWNKTSWQDRAHFFGVSAGLMRRILVDFARKRPRLAPHREARQVSLEEAAAISKERFGDFVALDDALKSLAGIDPRKSEIVELRFLGGLTVEETAEVLKIAPITVAREWNKARAWLYRELSQAAGGSRT